MNPSITNTGAGDWQEYTLDGSPIHDRTHSHLSCECVQARRDTGRTWQRFKICHQNTVVTAAPLCHTRIIYYIIYLLPLVTDLKHGHDGCRKGVKICWRVVFEDEPVAGTGLTKRWESKAELCFILFCSPRNQFCPSQETRWVVLLATLFP